MKTKLDKELLDTMSKNPSNWKGTIYFNRKDPRLMVPKQHASLGWTLNFGSPYSYIFIIALVLIILATQYL